MPEAEPESDGRPPAGSSPFQYSLRTALLVMTGFAVLFSLLKTFGIGGFLARACAVGFVLSAILWPLLWYYRLCKKHDLW